MIVGYSENTPIETEDGIKLAKDIRLTDKILSVTGDYNDIHHIEYNAVRQRLFKLSYSDKSVIMSEIHWIGTDKGLMPIIYLDKKKGDKIAWYSNGEVEYISDYEVEILPVTKDNLITMTVSNDKRVIADGFILHN